MIMPFLSKQKRPTEVRLSFFILSSRRRSARPFSKARHPKTGALSAMAIVIIANGIRPKPCQTVSIVSLFSDFHAKRAGNSKKIFFEGRKKRTGNATRLVKTKDRECGLSFCLF